ncbi:MAG: hypothetical protein Q9219_004677 [cf. Caloplaca sp. 3 TL-2023]
MAYKDVPLIERTKGAVKTHMSQSCYDASHDFAHIQRVLALCQHVLEEERISHPEKLFDMTTVEAAALLHDVDDHKYTNDACQIHGKAAIAEQIMLDLEYPPDLATNVQAIIRCVSYSTERDHPQLVQHTLNRHPELAVVQDADRLDALGATGIARAFTYGGAKDKARDLDTTMLHIDEKLLVLSSMMKTVEGKRLARIRTERLQMFKEWWKEETTSYSTTT